MLSIDTARKVSKFVVFSAPHFPAFECGKIWTRKTPQGYDQKRKLFRTNSFVLAHSSAKKFYIEQLTVKSSIQWHHMTLI